MIKVLSSKLLAVNDHMLKHWCPACSTTHSVHVNQSNCMNCRWDWDGDVFRPTITPVLIPSDSCKYSIVKGNIIFENDCKHILAGQTVPLPDIPLELWPK